MEIQRQTVEDNKQIIRRFIEIGWGQRNREIFLETLDPNCCRHQSGAVSSGRADPFTALEAFSKSFADYHVEIELLIGEGDIVAVRSRTTGIHSGSYASIEPSGRAIDITSVDFYRLAGAKIVESWHNVDEAGLLRQLTDNSQ